MSGLKASLRQAKECLAKGEHKEALQHCKAALKADKSSYEAYVLIGKAAFLMGEYGQAELAYKRAVEADETLLPAWKGLVELHSTTQESQALNTALERLVELSDSSEAAEKRIAYQQQLAESYTSQGRHQDAVTALKAAMALLDGSATALTLPILCKLADALAAAGDSADPQERLQILQKISELSKPSGDWAAYHEDCINAELENLPPYSHESEVWREARQKLLARILHIADPAALRGPCCASAYFEAALRLSEQLRAAGSPPGVEEAAVEERVAARLAHSFPWRPLARVRVTLRLHNLEMRSNSASQNSSRLRLLKAVTVEVLRSAQCFRAWALAAQLSLQSGKPEAAAELSSDGCVALSKAANAGTPPQPAVMSQLKLAKAAADLDCGRLEAASAAFRALAEETKGLQDLPWSTEQRLACLEGLALCALAEGKPAAARTLSQHLLGRPDLPQDARGRVLAACGWASFQCSDPEEARPLLEEAVSVLREAGPAVTDWQLAEASLRLGKVYWGLGGTYRQDRQFAHKQWLAAATIDCPSQAAAFSGLGKFYGEVAADPARAQKCFQRALALDPFQAEAGLALCKLLQEGKLEDQALAICKDINTRAPEAVWAWLRSGHLLLKARRYPEAISVLQRALRGNTGNANAWEALGAAYQSSGRLTAAIKAYGQATALDPSRMYSWVQSGNIHLGLGVASEAAEAFQQALATQPDYLPALLGSSQALLASARLYKHQGANGAAAEDLCRAERLAASACCLNGGLRAAWKLLGDIQSLLAATGTVARPAEDAARWAENAIARWKWRQQKAAAAKRSFSKALHLAPYEGSHWGDSAAAELSASELTRVHTALSPKQAAPAMRGNAARLLRGGLRLEPSSADLWAALGCAAESPTAREYALSRALQLEPKLVIAWAALGRLYVAGGAPGLADSCFAGGRSKEPAAALIWEGMATLAACASQGNAEKEACCEHALTLGGGTEAMLGFVVGALRRGKGDSAPAAAAAARAAEAAPLCIGAHVALGLVHEARNDPSAAAACYMRAQSLLQHAGVNAAAEAGDLQGQSDWVVHICTPVGQHEALSLDAAVQVNLGRALTKAGRFHEAVQVYDSLEAAAGLGSDPSVLLSVALAKAGTGASAEATCILKGILAAGPQPQERAEVATALCRLLLSRQKLEEAAALAATETPALLESKVPPHVVEALPLCVLAAALSSRDDCMARQAWQLCKLCSTPNSLSSAERFAVKAAAAAARKEPQQAARAVAAAVHLCPWSEVLRVEQLVLAAAAGAEGAAAILKCCLSLAASKSDTSGTQHPLQSGSWQKLCKAGGASLTTLPPSALSKPAFQAMRKRLHAEPFCSEAWLSAGCSGLQFAAQEPTAAAFSNAAVLLQTAQLAADKCGRAEHLQTAVQALAECHLHLAALVPSDRERHEKARDLSESLANSAGNRSQATAAAVFKCRLMLVRGQAQQASTDFKAAFQETPYSDRPDLVLAFAQTACWAAAQQGNMQAGAAVEAALSAIDNVLPVAQSSGDARVVVPLLIVKAQLHLHHGEIQQASVAAEAAAVSAADGGSLDGSIRLRSQICRVLFGAAQLREAAGSDAPEATASQARRALSAAAESADSGVRLVAHVLLAEAESLGGHRKKHERIRDHIQQAMNADGVKIPEYLIARIQPLLEASTAAA